MFAAFHLANVFTNVKLFYHKHNPHADAALFPFRIVLTTDAWSFALFLSVVGSCFRASFSRRSVMRSVCLMVLIIIEIATLCFLCCFLIFVYCCIIKPYQIKKKLKRNYKLKKFNKAFNVVEVSNE